MLVFFFYGNCDHLDLHVLTHSFPTRRSADLLPAATAIGRCDDARVVQVYWLAARTPGMPVENPRQVSAYRYPRQYGPQQPSFARAMLPPPGSEIGRAHV